MPRLISRLRISKSGVDGDSSVFTVTVRCWRWQFGVDGDSSADETLS